MDCGNIIKEEKKKEFLIEKNYITYFDFGL